MLKDRSLVGQNDKPSEPYPDAPGELRGIIRARLKVVWMLGEIGDRQAIPPIPPLVRLLGAAQESSLVEMTKTMISQLRKDDIPQELTTPDSSRFRDDRTESGGRFLIRRDGSDDSLIPKEFTCI